MSAGGAGADACDLRFAIDRESVDAAVLAGVAVALRRQGGYDAAVVVARSGDVVGSLLGFPGFAALLRCMRDGNDYVAAVATKTASTCHVTVILAESP